MTAPHMHPAKRAMLWINVVGGVAVLGSYAWGIATHANPGAVWGGVPEWLQPFYTVSMLAAAVGYFLFSGFLLFAVEPAELRTTNRCYVAILAPSALWMPLTFRMLAGPSPELWIAIRVVLALVGLGSVGLLAVLFVIGPGRSRLGHVLAIAGALAFVLQTAVLDALVWPAYFPAP